MRGIGNAERTRLIQKCVAREAVAERNVIMLALSGKIQPPVLAEAEAAERAERRGGIVLRGSKAVRRCARLCRDGLRGRAELPPDLLHQRLLMRGKRIRIELDRLPRDRHKRLLRFAGQRCARTAHGGGILRTQKRF